jgi:energy-coupling factor transport system substrate-specific component
MSWQLAAFTLLALALAGGFAWYERTQPDSRTVALVGVLAAFAALGRMAFAPLPNVKPTTDIVLISGYALGGAPGFVVGALTGLTSNFFFGQGPWTPWQMGAWGATGVIGALLARVRRKPIGRVPLAIVCAVVGYGFAAVQDVGDWVTYSDHSLTQLGVYVGKGTGFDLVHAIGCLAFALAFGPALAGSICRFAARLHTIWKTAGGAAAGLLVALLLLLLLAAPAARAASSPTSYLLAAQNGDGGLGSAPGDSSSQEFSGWAALGLASAGENLATIRRGGPSLLDYIRSTSPSDIGSLERDILVLHAAGLSPGSLTNQLQGDIRGDGSVSEQVNLTAFAVLALRAAGASPPAKAVSWLAAQQNHDGGFSYATAGTASDVDDTGAALEALGFNARAVSFIRGHQNSDGGFPAQPGAESNAQSTAWAVQGLLAAGVDPESMPHSPLGYLRSLTAADGHIAYSRSSDQTPVWVTGQALMALERKPLPLDPPPAAAHNATLLRGGHHAIGVAAAQHATRSSRKRRRAAAVTRVPPLVYRLAAAAGLVTATALAPVGA